MICQVLPGDLQEAHAALSVSLVHDRVCGVYFIYFILNKKRKEKKEKEERRWNQKEKENGRRKKPRQTEILCPALKIQSPRVNHFLSFPKKTTTKTNVSRLRSPAPAAPISARAKQPLRHLAVLREGIKLSFTPLSCCIRVEVVLLVRGHHA